MIHLSPFPFELRHREKGGYKKGGPSRACGVF